MYNTTNIPLELAPHYTNKLIRVPYNAANILLEHY
jgi:hypothetical protein